MNFTEDFRNIINSLQMLQQHVEIELNAINCRIGELEDKQNKDDEFYKELEILIQKRNK